MKNSLKIVFLLFIVSTDLSCVNNQKHFRFTINDENVRVNILNKDTFISIKGLGVKSFSFEDGLYSIYYDSLFRKKAKEFNLENGIVCGRETSWYRNGNIKNDGIYSGYQCIKDCRTYYKNGQILSERLHNEFNDVSKHWDLNGNLLSITTFVRNIAIKTVEYYENGKVKSEIFYKPKSDEVSGYFPIWGVKYDFSGKIIGTFKFRKEITFNSENYTEEVSIIRELIHLKDE